MPLGPGWPMMTGDMHGVSPPRDALRDGLRAGAVAGLLSGVPSTLWTVASGGDPLESTRAAGTILLPRRRRGTTLLISGVVAHAALSLAWGVVLSLVLPRSRTGAWGALAGLGIAALDLGVGRRRRGAVLRLPLGPQAADHVVYGMVAGAVLARRRARPRLRVPWSA